MSGGSLPARMRLKALGSVFSCSTMLKKPTDFGIRVRVARTGIIRKAGVDGHLSELEDLIQRRDAFGALDDALVAVRAVPDAAVLAVLAEALFALGIARIGRV